MEDKILDINYKEDKKLANDVLERNYFTRFRNPNLKKRGLEIFLIGACKANCEYCYLKKHQDQLYPNELHDFDKIVENFEKILNWYVKQDFKCSIDIFSAEWLTTSLRERIFDVIYNVFSKVDDKNKPPYIVIADNMQFLKDEEATSRVEYHIEKLASINIPFHISCSVDGKMCDDGRTINDDNFYIKLKDFINKYHCGVHPMISATNVNRWIANHKWWVNNFDKHIWYDLMTLEVRNEDWNENSIQDLLIYCDYLIDFMFKEVFHEDKKEFLRHVLQLKPTQQEFLNLPHIDYTPYYITNNGGTNNMDTFTCSVFNLLPIRAGDLSVALCHRTWYPELLIGKFNVENNEITDFEPTNTSLLIMKAHIKRSCLPHCEHCKFNTICTGFCMGSAYENYRNPLVPNKEVCDMYKAKNSFLIYKYYTMGLYDFLPEIEKDLERGYYRYLNDLIQDILNNMGISFNLSKQNDNTKCMMRQGDCNNER